MAEKKEVKMDLDATLKQIVKMYGEGAVMKLGDRANVNVDVIPSGSIALDYILGVGGYPKGRVIEIYGPESSGKTTFALHAIAEVQKQGGKAAFIDAEHAIDPLYAQNLGVNIDELILSQPDSGEQALEITEMLAKSDAIDLIVVDSVAALVPQAELNGEMGDAQVGLQARLMSKALRKLTAVLNKRNCSIIFINQLREKVGVMFGNPETTTGGKYKITEGVFLNASTLDYVGVFQGCYLDFEAKETSSKTGFPLSNLAQHQLESIELVIKHKGYSFVLIYLKAFEETYLVDGNYILNVNKSGLKTIPYQQIKENGTLVKPGFGIMLDYIKAFKTAYLEK